MSLLLFKPSHPTHPLNVLVELGKVAKTGEKRAKNIAF